MYWKVEVNKVKTLKFEKCGRCLTPPPPPICMVAPPLGRNGDET